MYPSRLIRVVFTFLASAGTLLAENPQTERRYLSGHDVSDAVSWDFSVTGGRRAGEKATIPVPSQWEQHGFGTYNYGQDGLPKSDEHGLYRKRFAVPQAWKVRRVDLVFEGVMTDATVKVNGVSAGPVHHGAFYRFRYDITSLVKFGASAQNLLEVDVAKISANSFTEIGERDGDYWVFGGIFRPVWLEAVPLQSIEQTAIDAKADGSMNVWVKLAGLQDADRIEGRILDAAGQPVGTPISTVIPQGSKGDLSVTAQLEKPRLWTAETPNLYSLELTLRKGEAALHTVTTRFGFRTFEVKPGDGFYLNGQRILLKGANRHSFRPETGRALSREDCYADARLLKSMNMNAVRMSHYPPDEAFLEACDELGLYVLDELSGWHHAHDTEVGRQLVREMVNRDVNHPSILFWDNGNEGGWNRELDGDFAWYDPQQRHVLHPWELHDNIDTKHYPIYDDMAKRLNGPNLFMPTEFLHALFDGGAGAGLEDYWNAIMASPFGGGGFIWDFADEGIKRTDQKGRIDVFGTFAPDGIVGPHQEKEGSYYTVRDLWSPVQIAKPVLDGTFAGKLNVANRYNFTSLAQCRFTWKLLRYSDPSNAAKTPRVLADGVASSPSVALQGKGEIALDLPEKWQDADALAVTAFGPDQLELWTWTWPTPALANRLAAPAISAASVVPKVEKAGEEIHLVAGRVTASFDTATGLLKKMQRGNKTSALTNGPRLVFARPEGEVQWIPFVQEDAAIHQLAAPQPANLIEVELNYTKTISLAGFKLEISPDGKSWKTLYDGMRRSVDGKGYVFPPQPVQAVRLSNIRRFDGESIAVKSVRLGYAASRFPAPDAVPAQITSGMGHDADGVEMAWLESRGAAGLESFRWTLRGDGSLRLDYRYALEGSVLYHGLTFDYPEGKMQSLRWLGEGPSRVWQNRLRGATLGVYEIQNTTIQPGVSWNYPEFQGCFAGLRWARLESTDGPGSQLTVTSASPELYLRVGTPRIGHSNTTVEFPTGDLSFLHAIPAIGSKFISAAKTGPASQPALATGAYSGSLTFSSGL